MMISLRLIMPAVLVFSLGCNSLIPANELSYQRKRESVSVTICENLSSDSNSPRCRPLPTAPKSGLPAGEIAAVAAFLVDLGIKAVHSELQKEAARYTASYSGFSADDEFYRSQDKDDLTMRPMFVDVIRTIELEDGSGDARAFFMRLKVVQDSAKLAYRLIPESYQLDYSKAKVASRSWVLPWTWGSKDEDVDIVVDVTVDSYWVDEKGEAKARTDTSQFNLKSVTFGKRYDGKGCEQAAESCGRWLLPIPRSVPPSKARRSFGRGTYVVRVTVVEVDDIGKRAEKMAELVEKNREKAVSELKELVEDALN